MRLQSKIGSSCKRRFQKRLKFKEEENGLSTCKIGQRPTSKNIHLYYFKIKNDLAQT